MAHERSHTNVQGEGDGDARQATSGGGVAGEARQAISDGETDVEVFEEVKDRVLGPCPSIPPPFAQQWSVSCHLLLQLVHVTPLGLLGCLRMGTEELALVRLVYSDPGPDLRCPLSVASH